MPEPFRDLAKLQEQGYYASEKARNNAIDRALLRLYKDAYDATVADIGKLYAKVGLPNPVTTTQGPIYIRKEDAIRYNQLANRLQNLADEMGKIRKAGIKLTEETSAQAVQDAYYRNTWAYDQAVGIKLGIPALPVAAIRASVYSEVSGLDLVKTWSKNTTAGIYATQSAIMRGITLGQSYTKVARAIRAEFDKGLWQAERVVRTEAGRCWSEGAEAAHGQALEAGLDVRKRWSATLDKRTRPSHGALDGEYADENGLFWIDGVSAPQPREFGVPEDDINCRCSAYDVLEGIEPSVRRIRGEGIVPYTTFDTWAREKGWSPEDGWPKGV
ncbi:MAG: phage minor head protein [Candidatus Omnitrophota bacterium]